MNKKNRNNKRRFVPRGLPAWAAALRPGSLHPGSLRPGALLPATLLPTLLLLLCACSDDLFDHGQGGSNEQSGLQFQMSTSEMGIEVVDMGSSRSGAATMGTPDEGDRFRELPLKGDNPYELKIHKEPLPLMGIHRGAVNVPATRSQTTGQGTGQTAGQGSSRAGANEVVSRDMTNFHDSLTIWGYTDNGTPNDGSDDVKLFDQILLTKVRNWRNSVEWPYGQGDYMKFYAVAPSLETINVGVSNTPNYNTAPQLTYTLPESADELVDVLYGESENISIKSGPAGSTTTSPKEENLGQDNKFVDLRFRHILTAIRFSQGTIPKRLTIKSISIEGSYREGKYDPSVTDENTATLGKWTFPNTNTRNYSISTDFTSDINERPAENVYIVQNKILFLLPQTLPAGATLRVKLIDTKGTADTSDDKEHTLTCDLAGDIWKKGYTVNYKITIGQLKEGYYLEADNNLIELEHSTSAVSGTSDVQSYQLSYDYSSGTAVATYTPATWTIVGYPTASDSKPTWLTDFHGILTGSVYEGGHPATISYTVARQEYKFSAEHDVVLSGNPTTGGTQIDLSTTLPYADATVNEKNEPANCYIINRIGTYKFPLVYGNKTSDGAEADCFKDNLGNTISHSHIKDQVGIDGTAVAADATSLGNKYLWEPAGYLKTGNAKEAIESTLRVQLLWQDAKGFITSPQLTSTQISFSVGTSVPANAVLALQARKITFDGEWDYRDHIQYGEWETLWTWHIWMTDEVYRNEGVNNATSYDAYYINGSKDKGKADHIARLYEADGETKRADILPVNLGWVPDADEFGIYEPRSVTVRLQQDVSGKTTDIVIKQHARQDLYTGTGTVYQWGRPTAFPAMRTISGALRPIYDINGNDISNQFTLQTLRTVNNNTTVLIGDAISEAFNILQLPTNSNTWFDVASSDYATANAMWNSERKTVYDPCPPDFRVPPASIFTGFSKTGGSVADVGTKLNMWPEEKDLNGTMQRSGESSKGGYFYCKPHSLVEGDDRSKDIPAADRYGDIVYMPATGEWHGNKSTGTQLNEAGEQINQSAGIFWTSDYFNNGNTQACVLWLTPQYSFTGGTADKPAIGFFNTESNKANHYSSVRGIRPMKN